MEGGFNSTASPSKISAWDRGDGVPWTSGYLVTKRDDAGTASGEVSSSEEEVTDTAKYFTLEPGKPTDIPASTITVKAVDAEADGERLIEDSMKMRIHMSCTHTLAAPRVHARTASA